VALWLGVGLRAASSDLKLVEAVKQGDRESVRVLMAGHADVNAREVDGTSALHWAVRADDSATVTMLVATGADVNVANRYGITPLWLAATNGNAAMVAMLLKAGALPDAALPSGETALLVAARSGSVDTVRVLIAHGADAQVRERLFGQNALMVAAAENHTDVCKVLIEAGADVNARTFPVPAAAGRGGGFNSAVKGEFTPLLYAARQGSIEAARALIAAGAAVDQGDPDGVRPLRLAIFNGHFDFAAMLIEAGADVNLADDVGRTPVYEAVALHRLELMAGRPAPPLTDKLDSLDLVKLLLARGADPNVGLSRPEPLRKGGTFADSLLGPGTTPLLKAAKNNDLPVMRVLLEYGADPYAESPVVQASALALASGVGWRELSSNAPEKDGLEAVKMLWNLGGFDINAEVTGGFAPGQTALHGAAARGALSIIQFLVDHGAKLDATDKKGRTPLDAAGPIEEGMTDGTHIARPQAQALLRKLMGTSQVAAAAR
jgi:ankyrin repeat protein